MIKVHKGFVIALFCIYSVLGQNIDLRSDNLEGRFCPGVTILNCTLTDAPAAQWIFDPGSDILVTYLTDNDIGDTSNTNPAQVRALLTGLTINPTDPDFGNFTTTLTVSLEYLEARGIEEISCRAGPVVQTQPVDVTVLRDPIPSTPVIESIEATYELGELAKVRVSWAKQSLQCGATYQVTLTGFNPETVMIQYNDCGERSCVHTFTAFTGAVETYELSIIASNNFGSSNAMDPVAIYGQRPPSFSPELFIGSCPPTGYCADSPDSVCTVRITDNNSKLVTDLTVRGGSNFTIPGLEANTTYSATFSVMEGIVLLTEELTSTTGAGPVSVDVCQVGVAVGISIVLLLLVVVVTIILIGLGYHFYRDYTNDQVLHIYWVIHFALIVLAIIFAIVCIIFLALLGSAQQEVVESCDGSLEGRCTGLTIGAILTALLSLVATLIPSIFPCVVHKRGHIEVNTNERFKSKHQEEEEKGLITTITTGIQQFWKGESKNVPDNEVIEEIEMGNKKSDNSIVIEEEVKINNGAEWPTINVDNDQVHKLNLQPTRSNAVSDNGNQEVSQGDVQSGKESSVDPGLCRTESFDNISLSEMKQAMLSNSASGDLHRPDPQSIDNQRNQGGTNECSGSSVDQALTTTASPTTQASPRVQAGKVVKENEGAASEDDIPKKPITSSGGDSIKGGDQAGEIQPPKSDSPETDDSKSDSPEPGDSKSDSPEPGDSKSDSPKPGDSKSYSPEPDDSGSNDENDKAQNYSNTRKDHEMLHENTASVTPLADGGPHGNREQQEESFRSYPSGQQEGSPIQSPDHEHESESSDEHRDNNTDSGNKD